MKDMWVEPSVKTFGIWIWLKLESLMYVHATEVEITGSE